MAATTWDDTTKTWDDVTMIWDDRGVTQAGTSVSPPLDINSKRVPPRKKARDRHGN